MVKNSVQSRKKIEIKKAHITTRTKFQSQTDWGWILLAIQTCS